MNTKPEPDLFPNESNFISKHTPDYQSAIDKVKNKKEKEKKVQDKDEEPEQDEEQSYKWTPIHNVIGGNHHKQRVRIVLNEIANIVSRTFGPGGELTYIYDKHGSHISTKDGYSVLQRLSFVDELSCLVLDTVRSSSRKVARTAGDGSTTSVIMANYLFNSLYNTNNELPSSAIYASLEAVSKVVEKYLGDNAIRVTSDSNILNKIATIAANNNPEVGDKIADIYNKSPNVSVLVERGTSEEDEIIERKGFRVYAPLMDSIFATANNTNQVELETCIIKNSGIFICDFDVQAMAFNLIIAPLMNANLSMGRGFTIIAKDFSDDVKQMVYGFKRENPNAPILLISHPLSTPDSKNRLYDLAVYTDAKVVSQSYVDIDPRNPPEMGEIDLSSMVGFADKVNAYDSYTLVESNKHSSDIDQHIADIEEQISTIVSRDNIEQKEDVLHKLNKRLRELSNTAVVVKVGGRTEIEREYKFFAYEDAAVACSAALDKGITPGGAGGLGVLKYLTSNRDELIKEAYSEFSSLSKIPFSLEQMGIFVDDFIEAYKYCLLLVYKNMKFSEDRAKQVIEKCLSENLEYDIIQDEFFESNEIPTVVTPIKTDISVLRGCISIVYTLLCSNQTILSVPHLNDTL